MYFSHRCKNYVLCSESFEGTIISLQFYLHYTIFSRQKSLNCRSCKNLFQGCHGVMAVPRFSPLSFKDGRKQTNLTLSVGIQLWAIFVCAFLAGLNPYTCISLSSFHVFILYRIKFSLPELRGIFNSLCKKPEKSRKSKNIFSPVRTIQTNS